jgi:hypothetical protein
MVRLRIMIDELSNRAVESELISLLATCRKARLYNANLARQLHDLVGVLKDELDRRQDGPCANQ